MNLNRQIDLPDAAKVFGSAARQILKPQIERVMRAAALLSVADVRQRFAQSKDLYGTPWRPIRPRVNGGAKPLRDTGVLMASVQVRAVGSEIIQSSNLPYAGLMNYGGIVRPKKAKFLSIPLTKEAKRAGSPRRFPRPLVAIFFAPQKGLLIEKTPQTKKRGSKSLAMRPAQYLLTKEVTVPARPFLGFSDQFLRKLDRLLEDEIVRAVSVIDANFGTNFGGN